MDVQRIKQEIESKTQTCEAGKDPEPIETQDQSVDSAFGTEK